MSRDVVTKTSDDMALLQALTDAKNINLPVEVALGGKDETFFAMRTALHALGMGPGTFAWDLLGLRKQEMISKALVDFPPEIRTQFVDVDTSEFNVKGAIEPLANFLYSRSFPFEKTMIVLIHGVGRSGKTALAYYLLHNIWPQRRVALYKFDYDIISMLNKAVKPVGTPIFYRVDSVDDVGNGSVLFVDDSVVHLDARGSHGNTVFSKWSTIMSHKDIVLLMTFQNTSSVDMSSFRNQRVTVFQKASNAMPISLSFERDEWRERLIVGADVLHECHTKTDLRLNQLVCCHMFNGEVVVCEHGLAPYWSDDLSKAMKHTRISDIMEDRNHVRYENFRHYGG